LEDLFPDGHLPEWRKLHRWRKWSGAGRIATSTGIAGARSGPRRSCGRTRRTLHPAALFTPLRFSPRCALHKEHSMHRTYAFVLGVLPLLAAPAAVAQTQTPASAAQTQTPAAVAQTQAPNLNGTVQAPNEPYVLPGQIVLPQATQPPPAVASIGNLPVRVWAPVPPPYDVSADRNGPANPIAIAPDWWPPPTMSE